MKPLLQNAKDHSLLLYASLCKVWIDFKGYLVNSISQVVSLYLIFVGILLGLSFVAQPGKDFSTSVLVVGYIQWMFAVYCFQNIAESVVSNAGRGTIDTLYSHTGNFKLYLFYDVIAYLFIASLEIAIVLFVIDATLPSISIPFVAFAKTLPLLLISLCSILGLGFALGGIALLSKKVKALLYLIQYLFVLLLLFYREDSLAIFVVPYAYGAVLLRQTVTGGTSLFSLPPFQWGMLTMNSFFYLLIGIGIFHLCEKRVLKKGTLSHF